MKRFFMLSAALLLLLVSGSAAVTDASAKEYVDCSAASMIVIEASSGRVLYEKNALQKRAMASTTKICTAITVIENCKDLNKTVKIPAKAVGVEGSSIYLQHNEEMSIIDLLYGLMLQSGNDCAAALALTTGGSIDGFARLMNETAKKAGAVSSNFVNPHGLHHPDHYTTASDLAKITAYAMKNAEFKKIVSTKLHETPWQGRSYGRRIANKNKILNMFEGGDGVKTGYTKKAGRCLVSSATRNNMQVIAVVLNCGPMFEQCCSLMERAFNEYELVSLATKDRPVVSAKVAGGDKKRVPLAALSDISYPVKKDGSEKYEIVFNTKSLSAPVKAGENAGNIEFYLNKQLLFCSDLVTMDNVGKTVAADPLRRIIQDW